MKTNEKTQRSKRAFNYTSSKLNFVSSDERLAKIREYIFHCTYQVEYLEKPILITQIKRVNSSGYSWRSMELTRQELLCLLIFSEKATNKLTAHLMGVSIKVVHTHSTCLRHKLNFSSKKAMVKTMQATGFSRYFPDALIDSLFDEVKQRKHQKHETPSLRISHI